MPGVRTANSSLAIAKTKSAPLVPLKTMEARLSPGDIKALKHLATQIAAE